MQGAAGGPGPAAHLDSGRLQPHTLRQPFSKPGMGAGRLLGLCILSTHSTHWISEPFPGEGPSGRRRWQCSWGEALPCAGRARTLHTGPFPAATKTHRPASGERPPWAAAEHRPEGRPARGPTSALSVVSTSASSPQNGAKPVYRAVVHLEYVIHCF